MGAPANEAELNARRKAAVASLAYAYMAAAYRGSPGASGLHEQFVRWYLANRSLYELDDATLQAMERAHSQRLTSQLGYNQISGVALGIALGSLSSAFREPFAAAPPTSAAGIPEWIERQQFFAAADRVPGIASLDTIISVTMDPIHAPAMAGDQAAYFVQNGAWAPVDRATPGAELPQDYGAANGKPSGGSGGGAMAYQPGGESSTPSGTIPALAPMNTNSSTNVLLMVAGVGVGGVALYYLAKKLKK